ncbi:TPA: hypothetical protein KNG84_001621 [Serratia fonticola]|nr:hypothetical protein [Serratia fonticola]
MGKPNWTESEMAYLTQHYEKTDNKTIGIALGRSPASISAKGISMGLVKCMLTVNKNAASPVKRQLNPAYITRTTQTSGAIWVLSLFRRWPGIRLSKRIAAQAGFIRSIHC